MSMQKDFYELQDKWNSFEEVADRYNYLLKKKIGYHPLNSINADKITFWDYVKGELVTIEYGIKKDQQS